MPASTREATKGSSEERELIRGGSDEHELIRGGSDERVQSVDAALVRGGVTIAESVLAKIAATAARSVPGIYPAGAGGVARALGTSEAKTDGIRARIRHGREVNLEMKMKVDYGEHIPTRGEQVRGAVAAAIDRLTDLETREIKVKITEITVPAEDEIASGGRDGVEA
jgi:uncharacterized alkaline shock family protein YloU